MRNLVASLSICALLVAGGTPASASECVHNPDALGISRIIEIDTSSGPRFGTLQYKQTIELAPKEVVLTFDDGPHKINTKRVLNALREECVKATFFPVGTMTVNDPETLQAVADEGHTIGSHTWSHPINIRRLADAKAAAQIERGFHTINAAVDIQIAPFFRFPGLNHSKVMKAYAEQRGYAIFSTDVGSDDWRGIGASTIIRRTMVRLKQKGGGIVLFHDTKSATAAALPSFLKALKKGGYKVVHIVPKRTYGTVVSAKADSAPSELDTVAILTPPGKASNSN
jgi:peptidoglycan/xylan/chitin deacetylase (PgdA/CDA1 family)